MASNLNYDVSVNTAKAVASLNNLQTKVGGLSNSFNGLKNALAGIAVGQVFASLLRFSDGISDLSDATSIAIENILGFQKAVKGLGGDAETADKGILRLVTQIGAAADGSAELQYAFGRVGVTLQDLATLSEQDILAKTIAGLGNITNTSERTLLTQQLLGKEFRNVKTAGEDLGNAYDDASSKAQKNADALRKAADAYDNIEKAIGAFKLGLIEAISPITNLLAALDPTQIQNFAYELGKIIQVLGGLFIISKVVTLLEGFAVTLGLVTKAGTGLFLLLQRIFIIVGLVVGAIWLADKALNKLFGIELGKSLKEGIMGVWDWLGELTGEATKPDAANGMKQTGDAADKLAESTKNAGNAARTVVDPFKSMREQIRGTAEEFARLNKQNLDSINLATDLIGKSQLESETLKAQAEIAKKAADEIQKLSDQKAKLTKEQMAAGLGGEIDKQIAAIQKQAEVDKAATADAIANSEARKAAYELEKFARASQIDVEKQIRDVQFEMATSTMGEMEKKAAQITRDTWERANAEIQAQEAARGTLLTEQEKLKYYEAAKKKSQELIKVNEQAYKKSREFSTGWKNAFREYVDNATNAAKQAERLFSKFTSGIEDLLVNFVKTGKFEWKNFVADMLETLLRSQIQQTMANLFQSFGGGEGGGIMGMLGGLFGGGGQSRGQSAATPMYVYDVSGGGAGGAGGILGGGGAGGTGGGIFDSIKSGLGGVWDSITSTAGSVWDSVSSGIGSVASSIGNIFSSSDGGDSGGGFLSSIGDMFSGWFANGGNIPAGKFGVVGEAGPELVGGPASVTPMGGATNVTYNINAVDAASFKAMIAADPSFIYAVSMQGASGVPVRR